RSRRELSLSNTKAASLRPSRPINLRPEQLLSLRDQQPLDDRRNEPKEPRTLRKSFVPAQCRGPYYRPQGHHTRHQEHQSRRRKITYNYGRDYLINVITRRGCKCDKCRKRRADVRAKARAKSRRAREAEEERSKMRVTTAGKNRIAIYGPKTVLFGA